MSQVEITLNKLVLSPLNMRQGEVDVSDLTASFRSRVKAKQPLLLQNLRVTAEVADGKETGRFEVHVGGRRLRALNELAEAKTIKKTFAVACVVCPDRDAAISESVEENALRLDPHPADQYLAFAALIEAGLNESQIADRYNLPIERVTRRLALARVSPRLMELYRADQLTLEQMAAFTLTDDHAKQEAAFFDAPEGWQRRADQIKARITEGEIHAASNAMARMVGAEAYTAAGGTIRADLFGEPGSVYFQDAALLQRLADERFEVVKAEVEAEGWKWVEVTPSVPYTRTDSMGRVYPDRVPLSDEHAAQVEALEAELEALMAVESEDEDAYYQAINAKEEELARVKCEYQDVYNPAELALAGAFVTLTHKGEIEVKRGFVEAADKKALKALTEGEKSDAPGGTAPAADTAGLSNVLKEQLSAHHTAALRASMATNPHVALIATVHRLLLISHYRSNTSARDFGAMGVSGLTYNEDVRKHADDLTEGAGWTQLDELAASMTERLPEAPADLWDYLLPLQLADLLDLLAYASSAQVYAIQHQYAPASRIGSAYQLATALNLDMADYWTPTAANYFGRVKKDDVSEAVTEAKGSEAAAPLAAMKKGERAEAAEKLLAGSRWLPSMLRTPGFEPVALADAEDEAERMAEAAEPSDIPQAA